MAQLLLLLTLIAQILSAKFELSFAGLPSLNESSAALPVKFNTSQILALEQSSQAKFSQDKATPTKQNSTDQSIKFEPNFELFFNSDNNATHKQIDVQLDRILDFLQSESERINDKFGEFKEPLILPFFTNLKIAQTGKFDTYRIKKLLKFNPDLNQNLYETNGTTPLEIVIFQATGSSLDKEEALNLAHILLAHPLDLKTPKLLNAACYTDQSKLFNLLLEKGAQNPDNVLFCVAFDWTRALENRGFRIFAKEPPSHELRDFVKSNKFEKIKSAKMRYLQNLIKFIPLEKINQDDMTVFLKITTYLDDAITAKFLLSHGLDKNARTQLKNLAKDYKATEILKLF